MRNSLLLRLLAINLPVIGVVILVVWLAIDFLAADYFSVLMEKYHISPTNSHQMFVEAIRSYLIWASLIAVGLAGNLKNIFGTANGSGLLGAMSKLFGRSGGGGMSGIFGSAGGGGMLGDLTGIFGNLSSSLGGLSGSLSGIFGSIGGAGGDGGLAAAGSILKSITGGGFGGVGNILTSLTGGGSGGLGGTLGAIGGTVGSILDNTVGKIFKFADGGLVTRPTLGLVGEAGPELILPLKMFETQKAHVQKINASLLQSPFYNDLRRLGETLDRGEEDRDRMYATRARDDARAVEDARRERKEDMREMAREVGREIVAGMKAAGSGQTTNNHIDMRGSIMPDQRSVGRLEKILEDRRRGKRRYGPGSQ